MGEDEGPDETPWEVSEYKFESPWWMEALFSPWFAGIGAPLIVVTAVVVWRLAKG